MRLVVWNCTMALHRKVDASLASPDLYIRRVEKMDGDGASRLIPHGAFSGSAAL
jgi:hypothetical protein